MQILTLDTIGKSTNLSLLMKDIGSENSQVPGPQFWDVDAQGFVIDETDSLDGPSTPIVLVQLFSAPSDRKVITPDMLTSWAIASGAPDMADQFTDDQGGQCIYIDAALYYTLLHVVV